MTIALDLATPARPSLWRELHRRQPTLAVFAAALVPLLVLALAGVALDPRTLDGAPVWPKPAKFLFSVALFAATAGWMFGYVDEAARRSRLAIRSVQVLVAASVFELGYIALKASRGEASHFNMSDALHTALYSLMGLAALALTATALSLAWLIARRPAAGLAPAFQLSLILGLVLTFILGAGFGGYMGSQPGHSVGAAAGGSGLPLLGWSTSGGDLRPAHFLGIHAQQLIPLFGAAVAVTLKGRLASLAVWMGAGLYAALALAVFAQALAGRPFLPL